MNSNLLTKLEKLFGLFAAITVLIVLPAILASLLSTAVVEKRKPKPQIIYKNVAVTVSGHQYIADVNVIDHINTCTNKSH